MPQSPTSNPCTPDTVHTLCRHIGFPLAEPALSLLTVYLNHLVKWNKVMNLAGPASWEALLSTLVVDSFHLAEFIVSLPLPPEPECWDLGAGAGLPGLPLRMLWRKGTYTLVETREKRALFLRTILAAHPLPGVYVYQGRAEQFMTQRLPAHLVLSRAFLPWEKVLELIFGHVQAGAFCLFLTLTPLPKMPSKHWTAVAEKRYTVADSSRYFWALRKA